MTSRSSSRIASPGWGACDEVSLRGAGPATRPLAAAPRERPVSAGAERPRFEHVGRRRTELWAAGALVALWVVLWTVFTAGVVVPASAMHGGQVRASPAVREAGAGR